MAFLDLDVACLVDEEVNSDNIHAHLIDVVRLPKISLVALSGDVCLNCKLSPQLTL